MCWTLPMSVFSQRELVNFCMKLQAVLLFVIQVRRAPQRRGTPRPNQSKPHFVRPVEDITEDELQLVADNMTEKVYNRVTVSSQSDYL